MIIKINNTEIKEYTLKRLSLKSAYNKHTELEIELEILDTQQLSGNIIEIEDKINYFSGEIYDKYVSKFGIDGKKALIKAYSYSKKMDIKKNYKIFQDETITYYDICLELLKEYKFKYSISNSLKRPINRLYLQYAQTDFEFMARILNDINEVIYTNYSGILMIGLQNVSEIDLKNIVESGIKNKDSYFKIKNEVYLVGDKYQDKYICELITNLDKNIYLTEILLCPKGNYLYEIKNNVKGTFLEATVIKVIENLEVASMKVDFSRSIWDKSKNKKSLSFSTPYSKTNTGFFPTPENGDIVDVYFPSDNENDAKVAFCINNKGSNRFCTDEKRIYISKEASIELEKDKFTVDTNKIVFISKEEIANLSRGYISMEAKDEMSIYGNNIVLVSKKADIDINSKANIKLKANKIFNN